MTFMSQLKGALRGEESDPVFEQAVQEIRVPMRDWSETHSMVQAERDRTRVMELAWLEAMKTVTQLNRALRRKNRQIVRLKAALSLSPQRKDPTS